MTRSRGHRRCARHPCPSPPAGLVLKNISIVGTPAKKLEKQCDFVASPAVCDGVLPQCPSCVTP